MRVRACERACVGLLWRVNLGGGFASLLFYELVLKQPSVPDFSPHLGRRPRAALSSVTLLALVGSVALLVALSVA